MATKTTIGDTQVSANQAAAAKLGITIPGVGGGSTKTNTSVGDTQVANNQAAAAKLGVTIPGIGGGSLPTQTNTNPVTPTAQSNTPTSPTAQQTNQQIPTPVVNTPGTDQTSSQVSYDQAQENLQNSGVKGSALANAKAVLANKYQVGLTAAQDSGAPPPQDAGQARGAVQNYMPPDQNQGEADTSTSNAMLSSDPGVNQLLTGITQLLNPANQTSSLMDDYQSLYQQSGLGDINKELIDADTVINGTEDDVRNEIQGAGGFGTESQVQAMSLARNKSLLTRYNQLVQMKTDATNQLNTMVQLDEQDKQMAQTKLNTQIDSMFKLADFQQTAQNNIREAFNNMVAKVGYSGAYQAYASDPRQLGFIEQTMGLESGGLQKLAAQPDLDMEAKQAQIDSSKASTAESYANINKLNSEATNTIVGSSGNQATIPNIVAPYYGTSSTGTGYIDASTLQGTAADKTKIINAAQNAGIKVITNKNEAADLTNIQNAYSNLDTIKSTFASITSPNAVSRIFNNLGINQAATALQNNSQKVASTALNDSALDLLKAISGIQGFRGNASAIDQIKENLPTIYDTTDVANTKISNVKQLIQNRESAILDEPVPGTHSSATTDNSGKITGGTLNSGLQYTVTY